MDFADSVEEATYRKRVRAWLDENLTALDAEQYDNELARSKAWQMRKAEAGFARITWPVEWGGRGGSAIESVIFAQEEARRPVRDDYFTIGLGNCLPAVLNFSGAATRDRFAGPALRGTEIWAQLFSEPAGGSDLAALRTRALREGDFWIVDGQKVWTSGAVYSDFGLLLTRTDVHVPKHKGLTMFWVDLKMVGIDIRPIRQMSGASNFNEVYFTNVRVADSQRVGEVGAGWSVAMFTLMYERLAVGGGMGVTPFDLLKLARDIEGPAGSVLRDAGFRQRFADWHVASEGLKNTRMRSISALSKGQTPGPENSIGKIVAARQMYELGNAALEMADQYGIIDDPLLAPLKGAFHQSALKAPGLRIAGGTDEILKNIIAEQVLGLPREIQLDKAAAFRDLRVGS